MLSAADDYAVLGLPRGGAGCGAAAVRARYRAMAVALHPDKCPAEGAREAFERLVTAYQGLLKYVR